MYCTVFANLNDDDLTIEQTADLASILIYIIEQHKVDIFEIDYSRKLEKQCKNLINFFGDCFPNEISVVKPFGITTYELFDNFYLYPIIPFGSYMICDENTKDIALKYTKAKRIIHFDGSNFCLIIGEVIHK